MDHFCRLEIFSDFRLDLRRPRGKSQKMAALAGTVAKIYLEWVSVFGVFGQKGA